MKKLFCLILCVALCLAACGETPVPTTEATRPPETTQAPTEPPFDPAAAYSDAAAALEDSGEYTLQVTRTKDIDVAGEAFTEESKLTFTRSGGVIKANGEISYGSHLVYLDETWADGTVYLNMNSSLFSSQMEEEAFLARYAPLALLDPENYGAVTASEDGTVLAFAEATAAESWLAPAAATVVSAEGTATLDAGGALTEAAYDLTYSYGGVTVTEAWNVTYSEAKATPKAPEDPDTYLTVESIDGPLLAEQAIGFLLEAERLHSSVYQSMLSQAAGAYVTWGYNIDATADMYRIQTSINQMDSSGNSTYELDELYRDGVFTQAEDGGEPQTLAGIDHAIMVSYGQQTYSAALCDVSYIQESTCTDLGSLILAEFTGNADWGDAARADACYTMFQDETLLDNLASAYTDDTKEFYVAVDKYTGLPTACGYSYSGSHVIDGMTYTLTDEMHIAYDIGSLSAYENITEEPAPDAEAEAPTPLFYHVTGDKGQEMWLFGTIHVGDDRTAYLPQKIWDALEASDALAVECDTEGFEDQIEEDEDLLAAAQKAYFYSDGTTTKDHISDPEVYDLALKYMKATGNYFYNTPYMKPSLWSSSIDNFYLRQVYSLTSEKGLEARLEAKAEELGKELLEVESTIFQIEMMGNWSEPLQELLLSESTAYGGIENGLATEELYALWCAGDEAAIKEMLATDTSELTEEDLPLYEEYNRTMSSDRNAGMLEVAKEYLESGDVIFYAVGLAHLLAEDGLVNTLRQAGYTVEQVSFG